MKVENEKKARKDSNVRRVTRIRKVSRSSSIKTEEDRKKLIKFIQGSSEEACMEMELTSEKKEEKTKKDAKN